MTVKNKYKEILGSMEDLRFCGVKSMVVTESLWVDVYDSVCLTRVARYASEFCDNPGGEIVVHTEFGDISVSSDEISGIV